MALSLILWVFQSYIFLCYGRAFLHLLCLLSGIDSRFKSSLILQFLTGLAIVTTFVSIFSLFIPLNALALGIITAGAIVLFALEWKKDHCKGFFQSFNFPSGKKLWMAVCSILLLIVLEVSTRTPGNSDTGIYHAQAIRWIETYPAVPGLGNLHYRLAYDSSWLVVNALFSFAFTHLRSFHTLPGLFMAVFVLYAVQGVIQIFQRKSRLSDWFRACLLPFLFFKQLSECASPGTDLPAILLLWFILAEWMKEIEIPGNDRCRPLLLVLLSAFAVTIKLSALPILLIPAIFIINQVLHRANKNALIMIFLMVLVLIPWMARNVITSGYLVYPEAALDLFQVDWKIPKEEVISESITIQSWARIQRMEASTVNAMPFSTWFTIWFSNLSLFYQGMLWVILLSPLILLSSTAINKSGSMDFLLKNLPVYGLLYLSLLFWLFSAPSVRFGFGYLTATFVFAFFPIFFVLQKMRNPWINRSAAVSLVLCCVLLYGVLYQGSEMKSLPERLVIPADYENLSTTPCQLDTVTIICADWYSICGYDAFPCVPQVNPDVLLRGNSLRNGFWQKSSGD
jgi:hypothetical protein